jgi:hypothetical protein
VLVDKAIAKNEEPDAIWFSHLALSDGLLVVANMPAMAFLVRGAEVKPLPDFFRGLSPPDPKWPTGFAVSGLAGTLEDLRFRVYAPSTEYGYDVRGKPGGWKRTGKGGVGSVARQPAWIDAATISEPLTTRKGARLYEVAPGYLARAKEGFSFRFDGPARGEKTPVPLPGKTDIRSSSSSTMVR